MAWKSWPGRSSWSHLAAPGTALHERRGAWSLFGQEFSSCNADMESERQVRALLDVAHSLVLVIYSSLMGNLCWKQLDWEKASDQAPLLMWKWLQKGAPPVGLGTVHHSFPWGSWWVLLVPRHCCQLIFWCSCELFGSDSTKKEIAISIISAYFKVSHCIC